MKKRALSMVITVAILLGSVHTSAIPMVVSASGSVWNGGTDVNWYRTDQNNFDIYTAEQLAGLAALVNSGNSMQGVTINLKSDITLNNPSGWTDWWGNVAPKNNWTPIGHVGNIVAGHYPFSGIFNGNGYSIKGLYVDCGTNAGLFGYTYGAIIHGVMIESGCVIVDRKKSRLTEVSVNAGGIAGSVENTLISQCENRADVRGYGNILQGAASVNIGGIVGNTSLDMQIVGMLANAILLFGIGLSPLYMDLSVSGGTLITDCVNWGAVFTDYSSSNVGGIIGYGHTGAVNNSLNLGGLQGNAVGGIAGKLFRFQMANSYYFNNQNTGLGRIEAGGTAQNSAVAVSSDQITGSYVTGLLGELFVQATVARIDEPRSRPVLLIMGSGGNIDPCAKGHLYDGNWTVITHATYEKAGARVRYCNRCDYENVKRIHKLIEPGSLGDVDFDGVITIDDALEILKYLARLVSRIDGDSDALNAAKVTGGDVIVIEDALEILKYLAYIPSVLD